MDALMIARSPFVIEDTGRLTCFRGDAVLGVVRHPSLLAIDHTEPDFCCAAATVADLPVLVTCTQDADLRMPSQDVTIWVFQA